MGKYCLSRYIYYRWFLCLAYYKIPMYFCSLVNDVSVNTKDYLKYIKSKHCLVCGSSPVDADHQDTIGMGGDRKKQTIKDFTCIPLCRKHHTERHNIGSFQFEHKHSLNLWKEAFYLLRGYFAE